MMSDLIESKVTVTIKTVEGGVTLTARGRDWNSPGEVKFRNAEIAMSWARLTWNRIAQGYRYQVEFVFA